MSLLPTNSRAARSEQVEFAAICVTSALIAAHPPLNEVEDLRRIIGDVLGNSRSTSGFDIGLDVAMQIRPRLEAALQLYPGPLSADRQAQDMSFVAGLVLGALGRYRLPDASGSTLFVAKDRERYNMTLDVTRAARLVYDLLAGPDGRSLGADLSTAQRPPVELRIAESIAAAMSKSTPGLVAVFAAQAICNDCSRPETAGVLAPVVAGVILAAFVKPDSAGEALKGKMPAGHRLQLRLELRDPGKS